MGRPRAGNAADFLAHYGVKGMRWGYRKSESGGRVKSGKRTASEDFIRSRELGKKKVHELSNSELKDLNERMNLEQNYARLVSSQPNRIAQGAKTVNQVLTTANKAYSFVNSPAGKDIRTVVSKIVN